MLSSQFHLPVEIDPDTGLNVETLRDAAMAARESFAAGGLDVADVILKAANAMPDGAAEFDRGIAVGLALARLLPDLAQGAL